MKSLILFASLLFLPLSFGADSPPKSIDVTKKITAAIHDNTLSLVVSSSDLGAVDADPPKLRITYQATNRIRTRTWMEGQTVNLAAPAGHLLSITSAEFGRFDDPVDVTPAVAALVKDNAIPPITVDDESMGGIDSAHGVLKQLVVRYAIDGHQKMLSADQSENLAIPAPPDGKKLTILEATYGLPTTVYDVTEIVADLMQGNVLTITPSDDLFGDPAPGLAGKNLQITYVQAGQKQTVSAEAGKQLVITPINSSPMIILNATYGVK